MGRTAQGSLRVTRALVLAAGFVAASAGMSVAQPKQPIGRFVADLRAASAGLPTSEGLTPSVPEGTSLPARSLGWEIGAQVYVARTSTVALGIGATWLTASGSQAPPPLPEGTEAPPDSINPEVTTRVTSFTPTVSLNFGHSMGWSYVSAGYGRTRVESEAIPPPRSTNTYDPIETDWIGTINFGGGARWFVSEHVGVNFDLRWYLVGSVEPTATQPAADGATLFTVGAGISIK